MWTFAYLCLALTSRDGSAQSGETGATDLDGMWVVVDHTDDSVVGLVELDNGVELFGSETEGSTVEVLEGAFPSYRVRWSFGESIEEPDPAKAELAGIEITD